MANLVHRAHESDFGNAMNGFEAGDTISIRRPTDFTVRDGAVAVNQDIVEGKTTLTVDKQKGVDFGFTSKELTLNIGSCPSGSSSPRWSSLPTRSIAT
jgi:hypothetical protein